MIDGPYFTAHTFANAAFGTGSALDTALRFRDCLIRSETEFNFFKVDLPLSRLTLRHFRPKFSGSILRDFHMFPCTQRLIRRQTP
jgi:hypothetical protein